MYRGQLNVYFAAFEESYKIIWLFFEDWQNDSITWTVAVLARAQGSVPRPPHPKKGRTGNPLRIVRCSVPEPSYALSIIRTAVCPPGGCTWQEGGGGLY